MKQHTVPAVRSFSETIRRKRHALLGTACALALVIVPVTGSAVVVAVTTAGSTPTAVATQIAAPLAATVTPAQTPAPASDPIAVAPVRADRRGGGRR
jgi:hypothetical protein